MEFSEKLMAQAAAALLYTENHALNAWFSVYNEPLPRIPRKGPYHSASKTVSRVLYLTVIYLDALLPVRSSHPGSGRASLYAPIPVLLRIEFTASRCSHVMGELLPRLSTLARERNSHGRYISVALFLKSPSAGVTRYPCPVEPGLSS